MNQPSQGLRIAFLDYLRIIAFVSVLIGHTFHEQLSSIAADTGVHPTRNLR
jgi:peptidoglycan/LPS O-acetylase OafA/YrhL